MKVTKLVYGEGFKKQVGKHEALIIIYNTIEHIINDNDTKKLTDIHVILRNKVAKLNQEEFDKYFKE